MTALLKKIVDYIEPQKFVASRYGRKHTPDILQLQQFKRHLVFIPCDLQKGKRNHHFLKDAEPYGLGYTRRKFSVYQKNLGNESFPIPLPANEDRTYIRNRMNDQFTPPPAALRGELYFVSPETLAEKLDNYKLNGVEFDRQRVEVRFPYYEPYRTTDRDTGQVYIAFTDEQVYILSAWMYVGIEEYWQGQLDAGYLFSACKTYKSRKKWLDHFYEFR